MSTEVQALKDFFAAINRNDMQAIAKDFDPRIVRVEPEGFPTAGTYRGVEEVREHVTKGRGTWAEGTCEPEKFLVNGDKVVVFLRAWVRQKTRSHWTGGRFADGFAFRDGKITEYRSFGARGDALQWAGIEDTPRIQSLRKPQVCVLGSAEPGSLAYDLAAQAGEALAALGITVVSGCGSPATRVAAERASLAGGLVLSIVPPDEMPPPDWPATVVVPCGMGDARNLLMALAGDACIVIGGRAGTKSEVHLAWMHKRPLLPLVGCGGWSDELPANPPDDRASSAILPWSTIDELKVHLRNLQLADQT